MAEPVGSDYGVGGGTSAVHGPVFRAGLQTNVERVTASRPNGDAVIDGDEGAA